MVPAYLVVLVASLLWVLGNRLGTERFPQVDSGQFVVRFRAPPGSDFECAGAEDRLRPILMTACAMTVGMVPMALGLERGSRDGGAARAGR